MPPPCCGAWGWVPVPQHREWLPGRPTAPPEGARGPFPRPLQLPRLCSPDGQRRRALQETLVFLPLGDPPPKVRQAGASKEWALDRPCREEDGGPPASRGAGGAPSQGLASPSSAGTLPCLLQRPSGSRGASRRVPAGRPSPTDPRGLRQLAGRSPVGPFPSLSSCLGAHPASVTSPAPERLLCLRCQSWAWQGYTPNPSGLTPPRSGPQVWPPGSIYEPYLCPLLMGLARPVT